MYQLLKNGRLSRVVLSRPAGGHSIGTFLGSESYRIE